MMGIDYGTRRVGVALSDESGFYAFPATVIPNDTNLIREIKNICDKEEVSEIVLGESLNYDNKPNDIMIAVESFKKDLEKEGFTVYFEPEHMTSIEAERIIGKDKESDARAAAIILKSYIDRRVNESNR